MLAAASTACGASKSNGTRKKQYLDNNSVHMIFYWNDI